MVMNKLLLATIALVAFSAGSAGAADIPIKAPMARQCAADQFRGGYAGINGGGVYWTANRTDQDEVLVDTATYVQKKWGGAVGGQIGYNWTTCNTVWGFEVDGDWVYDKSRMQLIPNAALFNINITSRFDALATARTRAGIVVDNMLFYTTGGLAAGHFKTTYTNQFLGIPAVVAGFTDQAQNNQWRWGLAAGFGTEWAWSNSVSIRSEVLYVDFVERERRFLFAPPATFANFKESDSAWISRISLNVRLGGQ
jgi:outer membrane immunogenic protein